MSEQRWTFEGAVNAAFPGLPECMTLDEAERRVRNVLVYLADHGALVASSTPDGPRTWTLPAEPGPEVTAVRDSDGDVWTRWYGRWRHRSGAGSGEHWTSVLLYAPLTDASGEVHSGQ